MQPVCLRKCELELVAFMTTWLKHFDIVFYFTHFSCLQFISFCVLFLYWGMPCSNQGMITKEHLSAGCNNGRDRGFVGCFIWLMETRVSFPSEEFRVRKQMKLELL